MNNRFVPIAFLLALAFANCPGATTQPAGGMAPTASAREHPCQRQVQFLSVQVRVALDLAEVEHAPQLRQ